MKRIIEDEELNLQDLIFILLFFFIIAQTLIVFKVQKDLIVPPKVDTETEIEVEDDKQVVTLIIDRESNIAALVESREDLLAGFADEEQWEEYCKPILGREMYLASEREDAHKKIDKRLRELISEAGFKEPIVGLIADHRARYGTIFQVNLAVQQLIKDKMIDPSIKWKVLISKKGQTLEEEVEKMQQQLLQNGDK
ncbi:MAG: biopolymer transporter ExbD [Candidatus Lernaella stagnicola]|nr:biopolymer transporter ExbD [Candidatus Lernaella stagnicola]